MGKKSESGEKKSASDEKRNQSKRTFLYPGRKNTMSTMSSGNPATDQLWTSMIYILFVRDYSLSGDYRHIVVKPQDIEWQVFRYNDVNIPLALSDMDILNGEPEPKSVEGMIYVSTDMTPY